MSGANRSIQGDTQRSSRPGGAQDNSPGCQPWEIEPETLSSAVAATETLAAIPEHCWTSQQCHPIHHIVFAGGGTAGHIFPGLAVAQRLRQLRAQVQITFVGSGSERERQWVVDAGFAYHAFASHALPRSLSGVFPFVWRNARGYFSARRWLRQHACDRVVGLGGFASVPAVRAAIDIGLPVVLMEQNALPGRATRWLARHAEAVCTAFEETAVHLPRGCRVVTTGNPTRSEFSGAESPLPPAPQLTILGGSRGAHALNVSVPKALARIAPLLQGWRIIHQTGAHDCRPTQMLYAQLGLAAEVTPFLTDMPSALRQSRLAISRAGGTTLAELSASGVPAVLIPYPHAADDHQLRNAAVVAAAGAGVCVDQREHGEQLDQALAAAVSGILDDAARRQAMSAAMRRIARPNAADEVARMLLSLRPLSD